MSNKMAWWGNGKHSKNIFTLSLWRFRLELWKDLPTKPQSGSNKLGEEKV